MAKLENFSNLTKLQEDLLTKGFCFSQIYAIAVYSRGENGLGSKSTIRQIPSDTHIPHTFGSVSFSYDMPQLALKQEINTSKLYKTAIEYLHMKNQSKTRCELKHDGSTGIQNKSISYEFTNEKHRTEVSLTDDPSIKIATVTGRDNFGGGIELALGLNSFRFKTYNAAFYWFTDVHRIAIKHISKNQTALTLGDLVCSMYYNFSKDTKFGASITYSSEKTVDVKVGTQYKVSDDLTIKTRGDSEGALALSLRNKINPYVTLVKATQFNVKSLSQNHNPKMEFSFRVKINQ